MFANPSLAARIERAEAALSADIGRCARVRARTADAFVEDVGGGVAVYSGAGSPVNKVIGVGFGEPPDAVRLGQIESLYGARGCGVQAEVATLADPAWHAALGPRGYALAGFEHVLGLRLDAPGLTTAPGEVSGTTTSRGELPGPDQVVVTECGASEAAAWLDAVVTGFCHPDEVSAQAAGQDYPRDAIELVCGDFAVVPGIRFYLARVGGVVAGGASLREFDGIAQLCGAATLPAFRRRGVQTALLQARLSDAARRGCDLAVVTTAPGSKSQENAQRRGFALLYARALHVRPAPG